VEKDQVEVESKEAQQLFLKKLIKEFTEFLKKAQRDKAYLSPRLEELTLQLKANELLIKNLQITVAGFESQLLNLN